MNEKKTIAIDESDEIFRKIMGLKEKHKENYANEIMWTKWKESVWCDTWLHLNVWIMV